MLCALALAFLHTLAFGASDIPAPQRITGPASMNGPELIYRLTQFVDWPPDRAHGIMRICLTGDDPDHSAWQELQRRHWREGTVTVVRLTAFNQADKCKVVVVGRSLQKQARVLIADLAKCNALTVAAFNGFASLGGMVELSAAGPRRVMTLNPEAARRAGLRVNGGVLSVTAIARAGRGD